MTVSHTNHVAKELTQQRGTVTTLIYPSFHPPSNLAIHPSVHPSSQPPTIPPIIHLFVNLHPSTQSEQWKGKYAAVLPNCATTSSSVELIVSIVEERRPMRSYAHACTHQSLRCLHTLGLRWRISDLAPRL